MIFIVSVVSDRFWLQALEHCLCAGEPINPEVMWKWKELTGLHIYEGYGQTETVKLIWEKAINLYLHSCSHNFMLDIHRSKKLLSIQVLIAGTFKGMKIKPGSFGKAAPRYDVQVTKQQILRLIFPAKWFVKFFVVLVEGSGWRWHHRTTRTGGKPGH